MRWSKDDKVSELTNSDAEPRALKSKEDKNAANAREYMNSENAAINYSTVTSEETKSTLEVRSCESNM